jgi:hypothetical protein
MVAFAGIAKDLVKGVFEQVLDIVALEETGMAQHHRRHGMRLKGPAQDGVVLERLFRQPAAGNQLDELAAEIAMLRALDVLGETALELLRRSGGDRCRPVRHGFNPCRYSRRPSGASAALR